MTDKFHLGRVFVSKGAKAALSMDEVSSMLIRHAAGERHVSGTGSQVVSEFASAAHAVNRCRSGSSRSRRSSRARAQYVEGDDMTRAALVERYLKLQALPRE
jgi:hypothetical protein